MFLGTVLRDDISLYLYSWLYFPHAVAGPQAKFFSLFSPEGTPLVLVPLLALIELISYIAKGLSLGIRLGANLISGHLLLLILAGFGYLGLTAQFALRITGGPAAIALITAISGLELAIAGIQSYVYSILTSSYIKDSVYLH